MGVFSGAESVGLWRQQVVDQLMNETDGNGHIFSFILLNLYLPRQAIKSRSSFTNAAWSKSSGCSRVGSGGGLKVKKRLNNYRNKLLINRYNVTVRVRQILNRCNSLLKSDAGFT